MLLLLMKDRPLSEADARVCTIFIIIVTFRQVWQGSLRENSAAVHRAFYLVCLVRCRFTPLPPRKLRFATHNSSRIFVQPRGSFIYPHGTDALRQGGFVMCGIIGYVGHKEAEPILVEG